MTTVVKPLKVDTTPPTVTFSARRKKRVETVTTRAADVIPPSGKAAGIKYVRIDWGDGAAFTQAAKASHTYAQGRHVHDPGQRDRRGRQRRGRRARDPRQRKK